MTKTKNKNPITLATLLGLTLLLGAFAIPQLFSRNILPWPPSLTLSEAGFNDIVINARGTNGQEKVALFVNNQPVKFWNLTKNFQDYTYTPNGEITVSQLSIEFLNDTWEPENNINYDVQIPYITVNGTKYSSEHSSTVSTGSWDQEDWCAPGNKKTQWLNCTGSFTYNIPVGTVVGLPVDPEPPVNTFALTKEPEITAITGTTATISWTLSENGQGYVDYGTSTNYSKQTPRENSYIPSHTQSFTNLTPGTTYFYRILSTNEAGVQAVKEGSFKTAEATNTFSFVKNPEISNLTENSVRVLFTTSQKSQARTEIGTTNALGTIGHEQTSFLYGDPPGGHNQLITGLISGTKYYYKVIAKDQAGNEVVSAVGSFTTAGSPPSTGGGTEKVNKIGSVGTLKRIHEVGNVSDGFKNTQMETIDIKDGRVYMTYIKIGSSGDGSRKLHETIVAKGSMSSTGAWSWSQNSVDQRTAYDVWHNAGSVVVDNDGYVHAAYNMHNLPWQYKVSRNPHDITSWDFKGQNLSRADFDRYYYENKTSFPSLGTAAIPGNQISYPAFYKDNKGDIYATYRFAAQPKRSFDKRMMSSGMAKYSTSNKSWRAIGREHSVTSGVDYDARSGAPNKPNVFAGQEGWTSYFPQLGFDGSNAMHWSGVWRSGIAGAITSKPCYLKSTDQSTFKNAKGATVALPLKPGNCGNIDGIPNSQELNSITSFAVSTDGTPYYMVLMPGKGSRIFWYRGGTWRNEASPGNALEMFADDRNNVYAISSGVKVFKKNAASGGWNQIASGGGCGYYNRATVNTDKSVAYIQSYCDSSKKVQVYGLQLK